jgi:short-subunit dehydrogenase
MSGMVGKGLALVTGASSGIGYELAVNAARAGFDLVVVASDADRLADAAGVLRGHGVAVDAVAVDLARPDGVQQLCGHIDSLARPLSLLMANAGTGLGGAFLDEDPSRVQHIVDTNVSGTLALVHHVGNAMRQRGTGKILLTGSIAGYVPGAFQAVYAGTKAFINSFAYALREELRGTGVTVTCLMPGPTETAFFARADMLDTAVAQGRKDDPAGVARAGFAAMMADESGVVPGLRNRLQSAVAGIVPPTILAAQHRRVAEPGSGDATRH